MADTAASTNEAVKSQTFPDHWSVFLHCTICFGFFHNPHTLECGHSFCKRCLKRLVEIAREDNQDVRLRRLSLNCPTCRHPFKAKPVLKGRVRTSIVIKHLIDLWKQECKTLLSSSPQHLRSICSQTSTEEDENREKSIVEVESNNSTNLHEEFSIRFPTGEEYFGTVMKHVAESSDELEQQQQDETISKIGLLNAGIVSTEPDRRENNHSSSDSESSMYSSGEDQPGGHSVDSNNGGSGSAMSGTNSSTSNISIPDMFSISRSMFPHADGFPARFLLSAVWFMYSLLIVGLAEAFLPYVMLFTIFFFLIVLR